MDSGAQLCSFTLALHVSGSRVALWLSGDKNVCCYRFFRRLFWFIISYECNSEAIVLQHKNITRALQNISMCVSSRNGSRLFMWHVFELPSLKVFWHSPHHIACFSICNTNHLIENIHISFFPSHRWELGRFVAFHLPITSKQPKRLRKAHQEGLPIWSQVRKTDFLHYVILTFRWFIIAESWSEGSELFNLIMSVRLFTLGSVVCLVIEVCAGVSGKLGHNCKVCWRVLLKTGNRINYSGGKCVCERACVSCQRGTPVWLDFRFSDVGARLWTGSCCWMITRAEELLFITLCVFFCNPSSSLKGYTLVWFEICMWLFQLWNMK